MFSSSLSIILSPSITIFLYHIRKKNHYFFLENTSPPKYYHYICYINREVDSIHHETRAGRRNLIDSFQTLQNDA